MARRKRSLRSSRSVVHAVDEVTTPEIPLRLEVFENPAPPPPAPTQERGSRWLKMGLALLLVAVCAGLYGRTLDFPMVFDDEMYLKNNPFSRDLSSFGYLSHFSEFATRPVRLSLDPDLSTNFIMRPVAYATFYLNYWFDGYNPRWYHVGNIAIHAANAVLIAGLMSLLLARMGVARQSRLFISGVAALLFAVHPLATESVTYIVQRFTSLGTLFYLLTLVLYFAADDIAGRGKRRAVRGAAVLVLFLGMQTNESTFTVPFMAILLDAVLLRTPIKPALKKAVPLLVLLPLIPVLVFAVSAAQNQGTLSLKHAINLTNSKDEPWAYGQYLLTQLTVVLSYLRRLFWPADMNLDPSWTLHRSVLEWPVLRALAVFASLIGGVVLLLRKRHVDVRYALPFAFVLWFLVTIIPSSGLVPLPDLMAEHRSYLPSIGIFIAVAWGLDTLRVSTWRWPALRWMAPATAVLCAGALGVVTWQRNDVWRTSVSLWEDTTAKSPEKFRVWANLAVAYAVAGRYEDGLTCSRKAEALEPRFVRAFVQTISYLNALNRNEETLEEIRRKVTANPSLGTLADVQYHFAVAQVNIGNLDDGLRRLQAIVESAPFHHLSHIALGLIYKSQHRQDMAIKHLRTAAELQPSNTALIALLEQTEKEGTLVVK